MEMWVSTAQNNIILQSDVIWLYYGGDHLHFDKGRKLRDNQSVNNKGPRSINYFCFNYLKQLPHF